MSRSILLIIGAAIAALPVYAQDTTPTEEVISSVKKATVFIQVERKEGKGSGSGFVTAVNKDSVLITTNYHVVVGPAAERKKPTPSDVAAAVKGSTVTVVFDGGMKTERSAKAEVIAADAENDLAILRLTGFKDPPAPISHVSPPKLIETMPVYTFGYPFGQLLATGKGAPAVTVGKASISSIRLDDNGEQSIVQIDGNLNPGNSGGPIVDVKGRLVGVAVAVIRESRGIGLAIPVPQLENVLNGRVGGLHVATTKGADGKFTVRAEVGVIDPNQAINGVTLHYLTVASSGKKPGPNEKLDKISGAQKVALKIENGIASAEWKLDVTDHDLFVQVSAEGKPQIAKITLSKNISLSVQGGPLKDSVTGEFQKPPAGWKEFTPGDKAFTVWLPEKIARQQEQVRNSVVGGKPMRVTVVTVLLPGGLIYQVEKLTLPVTIAKIGRMQLEKLFQDMITSESRGKVIEENDVKLDPIPGKDYLIQTATGLTRIRVFVAGGGRVFFLHVQGTKEQVESPATLTFLNSCRLPTAAVATNPTPGPNGKDAPIVKGPPKSDGDRTVILGFGNDPGFQDNGPAGGMLVGVEVHLAKFGKNDVIKGVRPVYLTAGKESFGEQRGNATKDVIKVVAKPGYSVGGMTVKAGLGIDGFSLTFMKIKDGKLDTTDSYESDWLGGKGGGPPKKLTSDGVIPVGLIGREKRGSHMYGLGLLLRLPPKN